MRRRRHILWGLVLCFWVMGCAPAVQPIRPTQYDYERQLFSDDPDAISEAITGLVPYVLDYARVIREGDAKIADPLVYMSRIEAYFYAHARYIVGTICRYRQSEHQTVAAAAECFLAAFSQHDDGGDPCEER